MANKTEAPTPRRLEEARKEGQVVHSRELTTATVLLMAALLLRGPGTTLGGGFQQMMRITLTELPSADLTAEWLRNRIVVLGGLLVSPLLLFLFGLLLSGIVVTVGQTNFLWAGKKIGFDFKRINPLEGFKRIFSRHGLIELLRSLLKIAWVSWAAYGFLKKNYLELLTFPETDLLSSIGRFSQLSISLILRIGAMYLVLAIADYAYQRWDLYQNLRMSKEEIKQEIKRSEGDPFLKSRVRNMQRQLARGRMMANVPKATVVVTNPTHLAIAIEYEEGMRAPKVLAKGPYRVAERIVAIARENRIPVVQNIPVALAIYKTIEIGQEITPDLYLAMAEILAYVYKLKGKSTAAVKK